MGFAAGAKSARPQVFVCVLSVRARTVLIILNHDSRSVMQRLRITHLTEYCFSTSVTLEAHQLLVRPREGHDVRIESSKLEISPAAKVTWHRDVFSNSVAVVKFVEPAQRLRIVSEVVIQHYEETPLDFIVEDYAVRYPFKYRPEESADLAPFLLPGSPEDKSVLKHWLAQFDRKGVETYVLLDQINRSIANGFNYTVREEPGVQSAAQTLSEKRGSCRDFAALFIAACRFLGLASRFVSGYSYSPALEQGNGTTHAWSEIFLPGAGWKGFDSTSGEVTGKHHIPVAVSRRPEAVPPVSGSFVGPKGEVPSLIVNVTANAL